jgi:2-aminoadipate transaminase
MHDAAVLEEAVRETRWSDRYAQRTHHLSSSAIRELLKYTQDPEMISFAGGLPGPEVFPLAEIEAAALRVLQRQGAAAVQYSTTEGHLPLRELLVRHMDRYGIRVGPDNVLITTGSQQALDLIGKLFINPGDHVLCEAPTFLGALQAFSAYQAEYLPAPIDDDGMRMDLLEEALRAAPKFIYVLPNFQNPAGVTLSLARRQRLVELASHYGVPIVEDDPYGQLRYEGEHLPPLVKLDAEFQGCANGERAFRGDVLYLGTLSKTLAPGLRIGWVVAPEDVIRRLVTLKQGVDLHTSTFAQLVAYETAREGFLDRHVHTIRAAYRERRDAMLGALAEHFPPTVRWTQPKGGLFLWVTLPEGSNASALLAEALRRKVAFVPGTSFFPKGGGENTLRLNFSYCTPTVIEEGVRRLAGVICRDIGHPLAPGAEEVGR